MARSFIMALLVSFFLLLLVLLLGGGTAFAGTPDEEGSDQTLEGSVSLDQTDSNSESIAWLKGQVEGIQVLLERGYGPTDPQIIAKLNELDGEVKKLFRNLKKVENDEVDLTPLWDSIVLLRENDEGLAGSLEDLLVSLSLVEELYKDLKPQVDANTGAIGGLIERADCLERDVALLYGEDLEELGMTLSSYEYCEERSEPFWLFDRDNVADWYNRGAVLGVAADEGLALGLYGTGVTFRLNDWTWLSASFQIGSLLGGRMDQPVLGGAGEISFDVLQDEGPTLSGVYLGAEVLVGQIMTDEFAYKTNTLVSPNAFVSVALWQRTLEFRAMLGALVTLDENGDTNAAFAGGLGIALYLF